MAMGAGLYFVCVWEGHTLVLPRRVHVVFRIVFLISLILLIIPLALKQFAGLQLFLPDSVRTTLLLIDEAVIVVSLLLGFRLSQYRWMRIVAACLLGILVALSVVVTSLGHKNVITVVDDTGPETLVIEQSTWDLGTDNRLYIKENALFIRSLNKNLITATSSTPFSTGNYTLDWAEDTVTIRYKEGGSANSIWSTAVVPLR